MENVKSKKQVKTVAGMTKVNLKLSKIPYIITGIVFAAMLASYITSLIEASEENDVVALGNFLYLLPITLAIFIPALHFSKFLNLGTKRLDFFKSSIFAYIPAALFAVLTALLIRHTADKFMLRRIGRVLDLFDAFGFKGMAGFLQMFALVFFFTCLTHTVTLIQGKWYGWLADLFLLFWIILFPSIPVFRPIVTWFYKLIIFNKYVILQIFSCLILGAGFYALSLFPIKNKKI